MDVAVPHSDWQALRVLVRSKRPIAGRGLRLVPSRKTKSGAFLAVLVVQGLVEVVAPDPDPFAATYKLTDRGRVAAEYGEYALDWAEVRRHDEAVAEIRRVDRERHAPTVKERRRRNKRKQLA